MTTQQTTQHVVDNDKVGVQLKLAALWTSFMFLYIYVDHFGLYMPGKLQHIQQGIVFKFDITQEFIFVALASVSIPALMIFLSVALPAKINRVTNIIIAVLYIPYSLFNLAGETWMHMVYAAAVEVVLLCLVIRYALKWPRD